MAFVDEIRSTINRHSKENGSNTPDFILASFLNDCLKAFDLATKEREKWYGNENQLDKELGLEPPETK